MSEFKFKNLAVWHKSVDFATECFNLTEKITGHFRIKEQLESSSSSVSQNIAEGEGRFSVKENIHYLYIARASLYEAVTILNILSNNQMIDSNELKNLENKGLSITKMINKLILSKRAFL